MSFFANGQRYEKMNVDYFSTLESPVQNTEGFGGGLSDG